MGNSRGVRTIAIALAAVCLIATYTLPARADSSCGKQAVNVNIRDNFDSGNLKAWQMPFPEDWKIVTEGNMHFLHMERSRPPELPRHPVQFALLKNVKVGSFTLDVKVRSQQQSMMVVFNYVDPLHFYYVHLSDVSGTKVSVHNGIFIVNGAPRRRVAGLDAPPALPDHAWHDVKIVRNVRTGSINIFLDKQTTPRFSLIDRTFTCGQIGLGSFDETGDFAQFRLQSNDASRFVSQKK